LLQMLNGILIPDQGKIIIDNQQTSRLKGRQMAELRQKAGLVVQFPEQQIFQLTVGSDIAFGPQNLDMDPDEVEKRVEWAMNMVNLPYEEFKNRLPQHLSSGERRRVVIAGVLAMQPQYLILDEPTAGLDTRGRSELLANLRDLNEKNGTTIIIVSHRLNELLAVCSHLLVLVKGEVLQQGDIWSVLDNSQELIEQGFDLPVSRDVVDRLRQRGWEIDTRVRNTHEASQEIARVLGVRGEE
ncbi:MAG TPA: ATP-binding cassette domain-containing protein, partial [Syntrophomonadaceae bacterium]|nr:ATP-binding cassette domain-containing protein [Syntrophomonadaceae bacterium]